MSVVGSLDAIAVKAETMSGLKRCYSATGSGVSSTLRPIPRGIEDGPVGVVWLGPAEMQGGNAEFVVIDVTLDVWVQAENPAYAYKTLAAFPDLARTAFRSDMNLGGQCTRAMFAGWGDIETQGVGDRTYLVLPLHIEVLITRLASDATA